jgi:hypothetical protein
MQTSTIPVELFKKYEEAQKALQAARNSEFSARTKLGQAERSVRDAVAALAQIKKEFPPGTFADSDGLKANPKDEALLNAATQVVDDKRIFKKSDAMARLPAGVFRDTLTDQDVDSSLKRLIKAGKLRSVDRGRYKLLSS